MPHEILMPKLGLTMKEGTVVCWLKREGEAVSEKEPLLEIETEKLSYSIDSPTKGVLLRILGEVGEKYPVRTVLGFVGQSGENIEEGYAPLQKSDNETGQQLLSNEVERVPNAPSVLEGKASVVASKLSAEVPVRVFISPVAKKMAIDNNIDYRKIKGSGPNGRIVKADIIGLVETNTLIREDSVIKPDIIIPYKGLRRNVGETMQKAWMTIPMVTHHVSADATALVNYRKTLNLGVSDKDDKITFGELMIKLTARALCEMPTINSSFIDESIVMHQSVHIGMATAINEGLVVPVIRNADKKGLLAISREAKTLASLARSRSLSPDDIIGATFTVSNLGSFGSVDYFSPIINPPQAAILGLGRVVDTAVAIDGEVKIRQMIGLSLTYDHRVIDGATAAAFVKNLMALMSNPFRAVLS